MRPPCGDGKPAQHRHMDVGVEPGHVFPVRIIQAFTLEGIAQFVQRVRAAIERGQLEMVFTLEKRQARMHLVKARAHDDARMEILSGVNAGEPVIVEGADQLSDGQPVEVK